MNIMNNTFMNNKWIIVHPRTVLWPSITRHLSVAFLAFFFSSNGLSFRVGRGTRLLRHVDHTVVNFSFLNSWTRKCWMRYILCYYLNLSSTERERGKKKKKKRKACLMQPVFRDIYLLFNLTITWKTQLMGVCCPEQGNGKNKKKKDTYLRQRGSKLGLTLFYEGRLKKVKTEI